MPTSTELQKFLQGGAQSNNTQPRRSKCLTATMPQIGFEYPESQTIFPKDTDTHAVKKALEAVSPCLDSENTDILFAILIEKAKEIKGKTHVDIEKDKLYELSGASVPWTSELQAKQLITIIDYLEEARSVFMQFSMFYGTPFKTYEEGACARAIDLLTGVTPAIESAEVHKGRSDEYVDDTVYWLKFGRKVFWNEHAGKAESAYDPKFADYQLQKVVREKIKKKIQKAKEVQKAREIKRTKESLKALTKQETGNVMEATASASSDPTTSSASIGGTDNAVSFD